MYLSKSVRKSGALLLIYGVGVGCSPPPDTQGPVVHITNVNQTASTVSGYVSDQTGVELFNINGNAATFGAEGGAFSKSGLGGNFIDFGAADTLGNSSAVTYAHSNVSLSNGIGVRVEQSGVDAMIDIVSNELTNTTNGFGNALQLLNPLWQQSILFNLVTLRGNTGSLGGMSLDMDVTSPNGDFAITGSLANLWIDVTVNIDPPFLPSFNIYGDVYAGRSDFNSTAKLSVTNGVVDLNMQNLNLSLANISWDIAGIPDFLDAIMSTIVDSVFRWAVEIIVADQIEQIIPQKTTELLDVIASDLQIELLGKIIKPALTPSVISTPTNGIEMNLGGRIYAPTREQYSVGSLYANTGPMPAISSTAPNGHHYDVGVVSNINTINQALSAAFESGLLNMVFDQATLAGLIGPTTGIGAGDEMRLTLNAASPATIQLTGGSSLGQMSMNDLGLNFEVKKAGHPNYDLVFGTVLDIRSGINLGVDQDDVGNDVLKVGIAGTPQLTFHSVDPTGVINWNASFIQLLVRTFMPGVLPYLADVMAIPIPSFGNFDIAVGGFWVADPSKHYMALAATLIPAGSALEAPEPTTYAAVATTNNEAASVAVGLNTGSITIDVSGDNPETLPLQFRYRLDGGPWSLWTETNAITLNGLATGEHEAEICSRTSLLKVDSACPVVSFTIN